MAKMAGAARWLATTAFFLGACSATAWAQAADAPNSDEQSSALSDIVITATRRETNIQDVPLSVTAVSGEQLALQGITDAVQVARVAPNVYGTTGYAGGNPRFAIRGFGMTDFSQGGASPVGIYVDDVYQPYSFGIGSQLFDLNRVEVLRGPQGTLFGKNTTAGTVAYFSAAPTDAYEGYVTGAVTGGEYDERAVEGMLNVPLSDAVAARIDLRFEDRDGYVRNVFDGSELGENTTIAGRIQLQWNGADDTSVNLKLFGMDSDGDATLYHGGFLQNICDPALFDPVNTYYANCVGEDLPPTYETPEVTSDETDGSFEAYNNYGATLRVDRPLGDWSLTSISAYQGIDYEIMTNDDGNSTDFFHSRQVLRAWQASQEFRVASPADRRLSTILGLFAMYDKAETPTATGSTEFGIGYDYMLRADSEQDTTTYAAFASTTFEVSDQLSLIGGLRFSRERKSIDLQGIEAFGFGTDFTDADMATFDIESFPLLPGDTRFSQVETQTWERLTWDVTLNYDLTDDLMFYARAAEGFRSGGYNLFAVSEATLSTVSPEILRSYEAGVKSDLLDHRVRLNAALFQYEIEDQQILSTNSSGAGVVLNNAGQSSVNGFEIEAEALPIEGLRLQASLGYTDATFDVYDTEKAGVPVDLSGNHLPYAPEWTAAVLGSYEFAVAGDYTLRLSTDWNYRSEVFFDAFNTAQTSDEELWVGNARIMLESPDTGGTQWTLTGFVNNLTDEDSKTFAFFTGTAWYSTVFGEQRTYGVQLGARF